MISLDHISLAIFTIAGFAIARSFVIRDIYRRKMRQSGCQPFPEYPHKDPILGYDLYKITAEGTARGKTVEMRTKLFNENGKSYGSNWIGQKILNTMDMENIQTVLGTCSKNFIMSPLRNKIAEPVLGKGLLTRDGLDWQRARNLATSVLTKDQAADLPSLEKHLQNMLKLIPQDGSTVDLQPLFKRLSIDRATEFILGESVNSLSTANEAAHPDVENFLSLFESVLRDMGQRLRLGHLRFIRGRDLQWRKNVEEVHATLDRFIDRAVKLKNLDGSRDDGSGYRLINKYLNVTQDRAQIRSQLINVFLAGRDQIGISLSLLMFAIARHPAVWEKIRAEVFANGAPLTIERVKGHVYVQQVIFEGFRLYSPVLRSIRHCNTDCILPRGGGKDGKAPILVPRGTQVEMDFGIMHRDTSIWGEDAAEFKPERWMNRSPGWSYIPFLGGRRSCPAKDMALIQMSYVLIRLAQEFERVENRDPEMELV